MNIYFLIAGILCFILGFAHSIVGESLMFKDKKKPGHIVPTKGSTELKGPHLRIIWANWHLSSLFGWCIGAFLIKISLHQHKLDAALLDFMLGSIVFTMFASSLLVLIATKGKHPGWIVLLLIGILCIIGN